MAAQLSLDAVIVELERNGAPLDAARNQLYAIADMQRMVGIASPSALAQMRAEIVATANAGQTIAQQSRTANANERQADLAEVTASTRQTIQNVEHELFEEKKLDPYLQFQSAEDEAEYRKREAERQAYIRAELAKGTPQGALNASNAMLAQLDDARDHGADRSPDFDRMYGATLSARDAQRSAMGLPPIAANEAGVSAEATAPPAETVSDIDEIAATLRMAGVGVTGSTPINSHGLTDQAKADVQPLGRNA